MKSDNILFIDIETVSQYKSYSEAPVSTQNIWQKKYEKNDYLNSLNIEEAYESKAAIFAEYGKIICISVGYYHKLKDEFRIKSFAGDVEKTVLEEFKNFCLQLKKNYIICGHNIKEFDIPYLCRRFLINRISIPPLLDFQDKKPWEIDLLDTLQLWKFGDYKNYTSLETLTTIFNIPTPKNDIDGSQVGKVYWEENDLERIVRYCQNDVIAVIQLYRAFHQIELIPVEKIQIIC
ncbi:MAG: ribonuclease H-like domain-containing protein [Chitinophagales bacterium]|jgi:DNA polymerase elongation subunit (family B)|nr:ribonuclease H-like domain-containing protein [Sphingobacteriales bacterium]